MEKLKYFKNISITPFKVSIEIMKVQRKSRTCLKSSRIENLNKPRFLRI